MRAEAEGDRVCGGLDELANATTTRDGLKFRVEHGNRRGRGRASASRGHAERISGRSEAITERNRARDAHAPWLHMAYLGWVSRRPLNGVSSHLSFVYQARTHPLLNRHLHLHVISSDDSDLISPSLKTKTFNMFSSRA